jgi:hypothetical protein
LESFKEILRLHIYIVRELEYIVREAPSNHSLGLKIANQVRTDSRPSCPTKYITDLDFANDIVLISDDADAIKTVFMMVGNWSSSAL